MQITLTAITNLQANGQYVVEAEFDYAETQERIQLAESTTRVDD